MTPAVYHPSCGTTTPLSAAAQHGRAKGWPLHAAWCQTCQRAIRARELLWLDDVHDVPLDLTRGDPRPPGG